MLSKNEIKFIKSLQQKKNRKEKKMFVVEGVKAVNDLLKSDYETTNIYVTDSFDEEINFENITKITKKDMLRISGLKTPSKILAVAKIPTYQESQDFNNGLILCLENIQDPGNLGTIIRTANWFGIKKIICSLDTVDVYNPKVIQASMGAFTGTKLFYIDLHKFFLTYKNPVFGTFLDGENIYTCHLPENACIVMGNEGNGISNKIKKNITKKLFIPPLGNTKAESLNVSIATAIIISEFKRTTLVKQI